MENLKLVNETIDSLSEKVSEMYKTYGASKKETLRARLLLEETLIKYQNRFGSEIELSYRQYRIFHQTRFAIRIKSPSFDPFTLEENPMAFMIESVMSSFEGNLPTWKYRNLENEIVFTVRDKAKLSGIAKIGIAVALSAAVSIPARIFLPQEALADFVNNYIEPISNAYASLFCVMAVLLSFFAISLGIVRMGDMTAVGLASGKIMRRFFSMSIGLSLIIVLPFLPLFEFGKAGEINLAVKSIYDILIGFVPSNIVTPFLNFNSVHIMIIGAMFGFSLLVMGQKGDATVKLFDEFNTIAVITNNFINRFVHFYVALKIFSIISTSNFSELQGTGRMILLIILGELILFAFYTAFVCIKCKIKVLHYFKRTLSMFVICLSSANFGAAFSTLVDSLISLDSFKDKTGITLSMGSVFFRPAYTLVFILSSLSMANFYGVEISVIWAVTAFLLSVLLAVAVPGIPGGGAAVLPLLFAQLGLPSEAISMMIAINALLQFLTVAVDAWCLTAECVCQAYDEKITEEAARV